MNAAERTTERERLASILSDPYAAARAATEKRSGRGDKGNVRNFRQMADPKLRGVLAQLEAEDNDQDALEACRAEALERWAAS